METTHVDGGWGVSRCVRCGREARIPSFQGLAVAGRVLRLCDPCWAGFMAWVRAPSAAPWVRLDDPPRG